MDLKLRGKNAIITGGSRGIGRRVPISDVVKNGFSLQPRRYVVREKRGGSIDINNALLQATAYEKEAAAHATRIDRLIEALEKSATVK